jgi:hypothetical protein
MGNRIYLQISERRHAVIERLAARTDYLGNSTRRSIIGEDFNFPSTNWNGNAECTSESQIFVNRLVGENEYTQVVDIPTLLYALLDVYLVRPESFSSHAV